MIASMIRAVDLQQDPAPLIVGERVNTQGSRKVKRLALADDYDGMVDRRAATRWTKARTPSTSAWR